MVLSAAAKAATKARMAARISAAKSKAQITGRKPRVRKSLTHSQISQKRGAVNRYKDRRAQRHMDAEQDMERRIDNSAGRSGGTPGWYKPREAYRQRTEKPVLTKFRKTIAGSDGNSYIFGVNDQFGNKKIRGSGKRKSIFDVASEANKKDKIDKDKLVSSSELFRRLVLKKKDT